ncbi:MAG: cupin domain-containing protein [Gammaproteobacteria bacterium]
MSIATPHAVRHDRLADLASRYVNVDELPWQPTPYPGVDIKVLMKDDKTGMFTALTRFAPGSVLPDHLHTELEQSWVLEGSLEDDEGVCHTGQYVWRPGGSRHEARAPQGALVLSFFLKPNHFYK